MASTLVLSGELEVGAEHRIIQQIQEKKISLLKLENCTGGNALAGVRIGEYVFHNNIKTQASGLVASACAMIYFAGKSRAFSSTSELTILILHGVRPIPGKVSNQKVAKEGVEVYLQKILNLNLSKQVMDIVNGTKDELEGVYFIQNKLGKSVAYCNAPNFKQLIKSCIPLKGISFESEGVFKTQ